MRTRASALLFLINFAISSSQASCPNVRLDETSLRDVPVMDQDGSGLCWAYAASTLIDAYRFSHGDTNRNHITSPIALAVRASRYNRNGFGHARSAIGYARLKGSTCNHYELSKHYRSTDFSVGDIFWGGHLDESEFRCPSGQTTDNSLRAPVRTSFDIRRLLLEPMIEAIDEICNAQASVPFDSPRTENSLIRDLPGFPGTEGAVAEINQVLSHSNPQPLAISLCEDVLRDHSKRSIDSYGIRRNCLNNHVATIVGSRAGPNGVCQYLVRNTYGSSCEPYDKKWDCVRGQVWIDAEALIKNTEDISWIPSS